MINIYKITHREQVGAMYLLYKKEKISQVLFQFEPELGAYRQNLVAKFFPFCELDLKAFAKGTEMECTLIQPRTVKDKLAAFCLTFQAYRKSPYTPKKNEAANLTQVTMSDKLLQVYFSSETFPLSYAKSINDYIRHYNYIRDIATNGKPVRNGFPDIYDPEYARTLEGEKLSAYRSHLHSIGWRYESGAWTKVH